MTSAQTPAAPSAMRQPAGGRRDAQQRAQQAAAPSNAPLLCCCPASTASKPASKIVRSSRTLTSAAASVTATATGGGDTLEAETSASKPAARVATPAPPSSAYESIMLAQPAQPGLRLSADEEWRGVKMDARRCDDVAFVTAPTHLRALCVGQVHGVRSDLLRPWTAAVLAPCAPRPQPVVCFRSFARS